MTLFATGLRMGWMKAVAAAAGFAKAKANRLGRPREDAMNPKQSIAAVAAIIALACSGCLGALVAARTASDAAGAVRSGAQAKEAIDKGNAAQAEAQKSSAETEKIKAETEKAKAETEKTKAETVAPK